MWHDGTAELFGCIANTGRVVTEDISMLFWARGSEALASMINILAISACMITSWGKAGGVGRIVVAPPPPPPFRLVVYSM